jgi:O-Antigen ligase
VPAQAPATARGPAQALATASSSRAPLARIGAPALCLLAGGSLIYLSFNAGGYFPTAPAFVAIVLCQALVLRTVLAERPFEGFSRALAVPLAALVLYGAWQLASALWSHATARALDNYDRTLLYALALVLFGSLRLTLPRLRMLTRAVALALAAVCIAGLTSRVLPHLWPTANAFFVDRLNYPLTYWNAEGMAASIAFILGLHLSADPGEPRSVRVLAAMALPAVAATLLLTFSRGSLAVAAIGLLAYCMLTRLHTLPAALLAVAAPVAIAVRSAWDATLLAGANPTTPQAVAQGHHVAAVVGACMLGAGLLRAVLLRLDRRMATVRPVVAPPPRRVRAGLASACAAVVLVLALALGAAGFAHREYDKFLKVQLTSHLANTRDRLTDPANNGRLPLWEVALRVYRGEKLRGAGAGAYQQYYARYRTGAAYVTDAHSLYLQSLAELGLVGLALIAIVVGGLLVGVATRIRGPGRALYAALFAVALAWALHQALDWDWQMPAVTLPLFMLAGVALARPRDGKPGMRGLPASRSIVALGWLVLAVTPLLVGISYARLQRAGQALKQGNCLAAKHNALSSLSFSAVRPQTYAIIGVCDLRQGFAPAAVSAMAKAVAYEPDSWEDEYWLAVARAGAGTDPLPALRRAIELNPREPLLRNAARELRAGDPERWESLAPALRETALRSGKFTIASL